MNRAAISMRYGGANFSSESIRQRQRRSDVERLRWRFSVKTPPLLWRALEFSFAACLAVLVLPLLLPLYAIAKARGGGLRLTPRLGRGGQEFHELSIFFGPKRISNHFLRLLCRLPALVNVMCADMSLVGPRSLSRNELSFTDRSLWKRFDMRPGFVGLWWIRKQANIDYDAEAVVDAEYADSKSVKSDMGLLLRSLAAIFFGGAAPASLLRKIDVLGVPVHNISMEEAIAVILNCLGRPTLSRISFVNVDCINIAQHNAEYAGCLRECDWVLADGIGLKLGCNLLRTPICQNVNGTDLLPRLCEKLAACDSGSQERDGLLCPEQDPFSSSQSHSGDIAVRPLLAPGGIYLLGGLPGVAENMARWMEKTYPGLRVRGTQHGYYPASETEQVKAKIKESGAGILLVALGAPKQELWIREHAEETGVKVALGVGGLFDFYGGRMDRAPVWMREIGMEWLFRLGKEPRRMWKRYLVGNMLFAARILWARLSTPRTVTKC